MPGEKCEFFFIRGEIFFTAACEKNFTSGPPARALPGQLSLPKPRSRSRLCCRHVRGLPRSVSDFVLGYLVPELPLGYLEQLCSGGDVAVGGGEGIFDVLLLENASRRAER